MLFLCHIKELLIGWKSTKVKEKHGMTNKELAAQILDLIGGKENVSSVTHCITRLRVIAKDVSDH